MLTRRSFLKFLGVGTAMLVGPHSAWPRPTMVQVPEALEADLGPILTGELGQYRNVVFHPALAPEAVQWWSKELLQRALPTLVHGRVAPREPFRGRVIEFSKRGEELLK